MSVQSRFKMFVQSRNRTSPMLQISLWACFFPDTVECVGFPAGTGSGRRRAAFSACMSKHSVITLGGFSGFMASRNLLVAWSRVSKLTFWSAFQLSLKICHHFSVRGRRSGKYGEMCLDSSLLGLGLPMNAIFEFLATLRFSMAISVH